MAKVFDAIDARLAAWIARQRMFFVATAPSGDGGHVNVSPKGPIETLRVLDEHTVAYLDLVGSGAETVAHLQDNGRIVIMLCAFQGPPRIVRLHGRGEVFEPQDKDFEELRADFPAEPAGRAIIRVALERIADSCGYAVPLLAFEKDRSQLPDWSERKGTEGLLEYQRKNNSSSIDGLAALRWPQSDIDRS